MFNRIFTIVREAALADLRGLDADGRGKTPACAQGYGEAKQKVEIKLMEH